MEQNENQSFIKIPKLTVNKLPSVPPQYFKERGFKKTKNIFEHILKTLQTLQTF